MSETIVHAAPAAVMPNVFSKHARMSNTLASYRSSRAAFKQLAVKKHRCNHFEDCGACFGALLENIDVDNEAMIVDLCQCCGEDVGFMECSMCNMLHME